MTGGPGRRGARAGVCTIAFGVSVLLTAWSAGAQGRVDNARTETRAATRGLQREIEDVAARPGASWVGYRMAMIAGPRQMCCDDSMSPEGACCARCRLEGSGVSMRTGDAIVSNGSRVALEPPTEFLILARLADGVVGRIRTFTPDCDIDAGGIPLVWLTGVAADDSVSWLSALVGSAANADSERQQHVARPAIAAIALHNVPAADRALESFVAATRPDWMRGDTTFWLGSARGESGIAVLTRMMAQDPSDKVREKAVFGLSVSTSPTALPTLIATAKDGTSPQVRGRALFWLAHKAGRQAMTTITDAVANDPDTEVKKKAVFALSQMPADVAVPKLIDVARTNHNPEVRKQAMFWLGESKDPRAVQFFAEILGAK